MLIFIYPFSKANYTLKHISFQWGVNELCVWKLCLSCPINFWYSKQNESTDYVKKKLHQIRMNMIISWYFGNVIIFQLEN